MLQESHLAPFRSYGLLVARILMGGFFLLAGVDKLMNASGTAGYMASVGLPESVPLAYLVGLFELLAGAAIIFGRKMAEAALLLAVFVLIASFLFHSPSLWAENPTQQILFMKNIAIIAGLLYMIAFARAERPKTEEKSADPIPSL